jgi:hypothetical protein
MREMGAALGTVLLIGASPEKAWKKHFPTTKATLDDNYTSREKPRRSMSDDCPAMPAKA